MDDIVANKYGYWNDNGQWFEDTRMKHNVWSVQKWLGYLFEEEIVVLQEFARKVPEGGIIINIGAGGGTSGLAFAEMIQDTGAYLTTIDVTDESSPFGCLEGERAVFESAGLDYLKDEYWFQIHGDSKEVGKSWEHGKVDFVFVDGDHSYEGCAGDIKAWLPHIKIGGYIAIHDYKKGQLSFEPDGRKRPHPKTWVTVDDAVDDLLVPNLEMALQVQSMVVFEVDKDSVRKVIGEG